MKRLLILTATAALALMAAGCQKAEFGNNAECLEQTVTLTVSLPSGDMTKAHGDGASANRCILEIYYNGARYGERMVVARNAGANTFTFEDVTLVTGTSYDFVFWADCADGTGATNFTDKYYDTSKGLTEVSVKDVASYTGNVEARDAFCAHLTAKLGDAQLDDIKLVRPFGQLNISTTDIDKIPNDALKPNQVRITGLTAYTSYNVRTGEPLTTSKLDYYNTVAVAGSATNGTQLLSVDYLFAPGNSQYPLSAFKMDFYNNGSRITGYDFPANIPVQANYQTNVSGALLTGTKTLTVTVDNTFAGTEDKLLVSSIAEAEAALSAGTTKSVVVTGSLDVDATFNVPKIYSAGNAETISITLPETSGKVTIRYDADDTEEAPANVILVLPQVNELAVNLPDSHVILASGSKIGSLTAWTTDNTLVVPEGSSIETLTVEQGNLEIAGSVGTITFNNDASIVKVYTVYDAETLEKAAALVPQKRLSKLVLGADIDLKDRNWTPIDTENTVFTEFDGGGHTISNLTIDNYTGNANAKPYHYAGLFYVLQGEVRNLTIETADVTCWRGGVLVGRMDYGTIENCHVKSATVSSQQKVGGIVGYVNFSSKDITISSCSVDGCHLKPLPEETVHYQSGGLIGWLQTADRNVLVEKCSVSNITITDPWILDTTVPANLLNLEQCYHHAFIGNIVNVTNTADAYYKYTVELRDNTVDAQVVGLPTCDRTDEYIGWWAGYYNTARPYTSKIVVDGVEKDRWIELRRVATQLMSGGDVTLYRSYNFALTGNPFEKATLSISLPTNVTINKGAVVTVNSRQIKNNSQLTISGEGTLTAPDYVIMNEADATLTVNGAKVEATAASDINGVAIYNLGDCTVESGEVSAPGYAILSNGANSAASVEIKGGALKNSGVKTSYALGSMGTKATATVSGGEIDGFNTVNGATATITGGVLYNDDNYYAVYIGRDVDFYNYPTVTVSGGYFFGYTDMRDVYNAGTGNLTITGGYFEDNEATLPVGYKYESATTEHNGRTYNYKVVTE